MFIADLAIHKDLIFVVTGFILQCEYPMQRPWPSLNFLQPFVNFHFKEQGLFVNIIIYIPKVPFNAIYITVN